LLHQNIAVQVKIDGKEGTLLAEPDNNLEAVTGMQAEDTFIQLMGEGLAHVVLSNMTGCSSCVDADTVMGEAAEVDIVKGYDPLPMPIDSTVDGTQLTKLGNELTVIRNF